MEQGGVAGMEELFAFARRPREGFPLAAAYEARLDTLFLADSENKALLELKLKGGDRKETVL